MIAENQEQPPIPFEHLFMEKGLLIKVKIEEQNPQTQITYRISINDEKQQQITFSNGLSYQIYYNDNQEGFIKNGTLECGKLIDKINYLNAVKSDEFNTFSQSLQKKFLVIEIIDTIRNACFVKRIDEDYISQNTNNTQDIRDAFDVIKEYINQAFNPQSMVQIIQGEHQLLMIIVLEVRTFRQKRDFKLQIQLEKKQITDLLALQVRQQISQGSLCQQITKVQEQQQQQDNFNTSVQQQIEQIRQLLYEINESIKNNNQNIINIQQRQEEQSVWITQMNQIIAKIQQQQPNQLSETDQQALRKVMRVEIRRKIKKIRVLERRNQQKTIPQSILPAQFKVANQEQYFITELFTQGVIELKFNLEDDETEFRLGILQDGNFENQEFSSRCLLIKFPQGYLKRGDQEYVNFLGRPFFRRDSLVLKVDLNYKNLIVIVNNQQLIPIKLMETFNQFAFICQSAIPLEEIMSAPENIQE